MGNNFCQLSYWIGLYGFVYLTVGSLSIAIYRILYIKLETLVKEKIGKQIFLMMSVFDSGAMVFIFSYETTNQRTFLNTCAGISSDHAQILIDYKMSLKYGYKWNEHNTMSRRHVKNPISFFVHSSSILQEENWW